MTRASCSRGCAALSFVESGAYGAVPARPGARGDRRRPALARPGAYERLHGAIRAPCRRAGAMRRDGREHERAVADLIFLHRGNPVTSAFWDWQWFGQVYADALRDERPRGGPGDGGAPRGAESAAIAAHWLERQPGRSSRCAARGRAARRSGADRAAGGVGEADLERDPGARRMWAHAQAHARAPGRRGPRVPLRRGPRRIPGAVAGLQRGDDATPAGVAGAPAVDVVLHRVRRSRTRARR